MLLYCKDGATSCGPAGVAVVKYMTMASLQKSVDLVTVQRKSIHLTESMSVWLKCAAWMPPYDENHKCTLPDVGHRQRK